MLNEPWLTFDDTEEIESAFITLVVKMNALQEKYRGGLREFTQRYQIRCNKKIAVMCSMSDHDILACIEELNRQGFNYKDDFIRIDANRYVLMNSKAREMERLSQERKEQLLELEVDWLKADTRDGIMWVSYNS